MRCSWCLSAPEYIAYHDEVWGRPEHDDRRLFEMLVLESFQSGLSWLTILRRQDGFREAFAGWDVEAIAAFGEADVARLLADEGIIRHRGKIEATIANASATVALADSSERLDDVLWAYADQVDGVALSKELKRRGFRFVGPTTAYSLMQAAGLVNDHAGGCEFR